ncbi:MAG: hypothetical protein KAJ49_02545, partial [Arcobacteraceae bacterium]|nr:hypothetical protein [Arcobacteraceae bacterium]
TGDVAATVVVYTNNTLYVGTVSKGIFVYDISTPLNPEFLRNIRYITNITNMEAFGANLYINQTTKIGVIDVSNDYSNYKTTDAATIYKDQNISGGLPLNDIDYFKISLNSTGMLNIAIDKNISNIDCSLFKDGNDTSIDCNSIQSGGDYYIKLKNNAITKNNSYRFIATQALDDNKDTLNFDAKQSLKVVQKNTLITGDMNGTDDIDYFKIIIDGKYTLSINNLTTDFNGKLYYEGGDEVLLVNGSYPIIKPGNYYIEISSASETGAYSYEVSLTKGVASIFNDQTTSDPKLISQLSTSGKVKSIFNYGNYVYAIDDQDGFLIIDMSSPSSPIIL